MTNDTPMLQTARCGVYLCSGNGDTNASADAVTDCGNEEDGMGRYLIDHWYPVMGWEISGMH